MDTPTLPERSRFDPRLVVGESPIHGTGVFATAAIAADEPLQTLGGILFTSADRLAGRIPRRPGTAYNEAQLDEDLFLLTPLEGGDLNYWFNHSCDPNGLGLRTRRDIAAGDEVTLDYATEITDPDYLIDPCRCRSRLCRGRVTGDDWKLPGLHAAYGDGFPPYVRRRYALLADSD